jgi:hypothetical protein
VSAGGSGVASPYDQDGGPAHDFQIDRFGK